MPIIRKKLASSEVYPDDIRYNPDTETVQSLINDEWVDNPDADPRNQTTFPPRLTDNTACDAAESVKDAFKGQIDQVLAAIDAAKTVVTIAGIILGLFSFGVFAIFITIALFLADLMLGAGTSAISAALTPTVYHTFTCIIYCNMNAEGRVKPGALGQIKNRIDTEIGGIGAVVLNNFVELAGEGGINNLAALGASSGSCDDCGCGDCDTNNWFLHSTTHGAGLIRGEDASGKYIQVTSTPTPGGGTAEFVIITTHPGDLSAHTEPVCNYDHIEIVTGGESGIGVAFVSKGQPYSGLGTGDRCCWLVQVQSNPASPGLPASFVVKIYLTGC